MIDSYNACPMGIAGPSRSSSQKTDIPMKDNSISQHGGHPYRRKSARPGVSSRRDSRSLLRWFASIATAAAVALAADTQAQSAPAAR